MSKVFYNSYTDKEKTMYKKIDNDVENKFLDLYQKAHKKSREQALYFIIYGLLMLLCTMSGLLMLLFNIFWFTLFFALAVVNAYVAYISFKNRRDSKFYFVSLFLMVVNVILDFQFMFFGF